MAPAEQPAEGSNDTVDPGALELEPLQLEPLELVDQLDQVIRMSTRGTAADRGRRYPG